MPDKEAGIRQKLKMPELINILTTLSDEEHCLTVYEIGEKLASRGINANRKTLLDDLAVLELGGYPIGCRRIGKKNGYFMKSGIFEPAELRLLADAVSSSRFITEKKSRLLIKKLRSLTSRYNGESIDSNFFVPNRIKSGNERIYANIDVISRAIREKKEISFRYFDLTYEKKRRYREGIRVCSPYALTWNDGSYYMVAYYAKRPQSPACFRVDKIDNAAFTGESAVPMPESYRLTDFMSTAFSMFSGESCKVKLRFDNALANAVLDRFGADTMMIPSGGGSFTVNVDIIPSAPFYGWICSFGDMAEILSPDSVRDGFREHIARVMGRYDR
ncbi:MAG: WYL domain-containing protein [Oscillospiraceae bacterium]|nr:WYL domain-containing protein [Oscillospiraceae bacterium]